MIQFNALNIDPDGKCFEVDASIVNLPYFDNMYINEVYIDSDLTFVSANSPSDKAVHIEIEQTNLKEFYHTFNPAELSKLLKPSELDLKNHIFFVFVSVDGVPDPSCPCGEDKTLYLGVAINWDHLYHESLQYIKQIDDCCNIPKEFIDYILRLNALDLSAKTGHFDITLSLWQKHFNKKFPSYVSGCGCSK